MVILQEKQTHRPSSTHIHVDPIQQGSIKASIRALCGMADEVFLGKAESGINLAILHFTSQYKEGKTQTDAKPDMIEKRRGEEPDSLG